MLAAAGLLNVKGTDIKACNVAVNLANVSGLVQALTIAIWTGITSPSTQRQHHPNCVFANNGNWGVVQINPSAVATRGNNTITGNGIAPTTGTIGFFLPM